MCEQYCFKGTFDSRLMKGHNLSKLLYLNILQRILTK